MSTGESRVVAVEEALGCNSIFYPGKNSINLMQLLSVSVCLSVCLSLSLSLSFSLSITVFFSLLLFVSAYPSFRPSFYLCHSVYPSICLLFHVTMYLSNHHPSISMRLFIYLSILRLYNCLTVCLSIYLSICLFVYLFICISIYLSIYIFVYLSICIYLFICLSVFLSFCLSVCLSIYLSICACVSTCVMSLTICKVFPPIPLFLFVFFYIYICPSPFSCLSLRPHARSTKRTVDRNAGEGRAHRFSHGGFK